MLYRVRVRTLALAEELGCVRAACRTMGATLDLLPLARGLAALGWRCSGRRDAADRAHRTPPARSSSSGGCLRARTLRLRPRTHCRRTRPSQRVAASDSRRTAAGGRCAVTASTPVREASASLPALRPRRSLSFSRCQPPPRYSSPEDRESERGARRGPPRSSAPLGRVRPVPVQTQPALRSAPRYRRWDRHCFLD